MLEGKDIEKVRVAIEAPDAITEAGLIHLLQGERRLSVVKLADPAGVDVIVVALDAVDDCALTRLDALSSNTSNFLLVVKGKWRADVFKAIERGVRAVLGQGDCSPNVLSQTVLTLGNGGGALPAALQGKLLARLRHADRAVFDPAGRSAPAGLDQRETDILRLLSQGRNILEISQDLCYSERTVKNILYGVMNRLEFRNRTHAVSWAIRAGLI